jgi:3-isopropylmalate dehydrogenase
VIPGDGVGPEVIEAQLQVLEATGVKFNFSSYPAGDDCLAETGEALPAATLEAAKAAKAVLFGAAGKSAAQVILKLRAELGAYANLRPVKAYEGVECLDSSTDMMIVRENSECLYSGIESLLTPGVATATRVITAKASERVARYAFEYARSQGRKSVTAVHKNNVLIVTDSLFLDCCRKVAQEYPEVTYQESLVDSTAMRMIMKPTDFDVVVTTNLFGDILSDLAAALIGGLGLCPSANVGEESALFEPVHGTAPDIAGKGVANPTAAILCGAMFLAYLGEEESATRVENALAGCLRDGEVTPDLGGSLKTREMAQAVTRRMG